MRTVSPRNKGLINKQKLLTNLAKHDAKTLETLNMLARPEMRELLTALVRPEMYATLDLLASPEAFQILNILVRPKVQMHVLDGGVMPKRMTPDAIGFDVGLRAIVSAWEMDTEKPYLRKTLFDFENVPRDPAISKNVARNTKGNSAEFVYVLLPRESVLVAAGFVTAMPFPMFYWDAPRSGLASKWRITLGNAPGTVDPGYRGEIGVIVKNESHAAYELKHNMRIAQIVFALALIPKIEVVKNYEDLTKTVRGAGGFGSTGVL